MVTATAVLALSGIMAPEPLAARSHHRNRVAPQVETAPPQPTVAASAVPMPQPRPAEAPPRASSEVAKGKDAPAQGDGTGSANQETDGPPPPSACRLSLTDEIAVAPSIPSIHGPGACGGDDLVRLEAVVLADKTRVALTPAGVMRCTMATAVVNWIRNDVAPEVAKLGSQIRTLDNFDSYECRGRNGIPGAHLSEHGHANAIDVHGFKLADGRMIELTDRTEPREFREAVLHSACTRFPTVLGPDSDGYHEDHIHIDLIERRSNYRICEWDVLDPLPKVAPLLPEQRPQEAPPRAVAQTAGSTDQVKAQVDAKGDDKSTKASKPDTQPAAGKAAPGTGDGKPAPAQPASSANPAAKSPAEAADKTRPEGKPSTDAGKAAAAQPAPEKSSTEKPAAKPAAADKAETRASEKSSAAAAGSGTSAPDKTASEKSPRKKATEDKPRRRRHRARAWNPFASFF